ncbi:Spx/MgsR family RNA polymerase-binding regulatory protein [Sneathiella glossodoripedis]|uniref:Spx/MgsR family RNA polymerase-binding regulatory protein n=1 Tax=Sneathiella glossodoripedis TaxID=418853 RepID=UPI000688DDE9|nr:Spx/MgsR family RNA polymerase-binding regulatory protein [Sneathiella glossodoripedis]
MITIYGIKTCDTVRKALKWADENGLNSQFNDFRKDPVSNELIRKWDNAVGRDVLVNKKGTTYRKLSDEEKRLLEGEGAFDLLAQQPTLMKRPVFESGDKIVVGFKEEQQQAVLEF